MSNYSKKKTISDFLFPAIIASIFFLTIQFYPFGLLLSIFSPMPIIFTYLQKGNKVGVHTLIAVTIIICLTGSVQYGVLFLFQYGFMAIIIAESIKNHYPIEKIVIYCGAFSLFSVIIIGGIYFFSEGVNSYQLFSAQLNNNIDIMVSSYKEGENINKDIAALKEFIIPLLINSFPAWIVTSSIIGTLLNYLAIKALWSKYVKIDLFCKETLSRWSLPNYFIWILIGAGLMLTTPISLFNNIGINMLIIMLILYFIQGLAIVSFYLSKLNLPLFLKITTYTLIIIQVGFMVLVLGLGVFDLWGDFRKLTTPPKKL